jgi:hypothetical protein
LSEHTHGIATVEGRTLCGHDHPTRFWSTELLAGDKREWLATAHGASAEESAANAERLALCWNAHDALVDALQGIVDDDASQTSLADQRARWDDRMAVARAALALAKGDSK